MKKLFIYSRGNTNKGPITIKEQVTGGINYANIKGYDYSIVTDEFIVHKGEVLQPGLFDIIYDSDFIFTPDLYVHSISIILGNEVLVDAIWGILNLKKVQLHTSYFSVDCGDPRNKYIFDITSHLKWQPQFWLQ